MTLLDQTIHPVARARVVYGQAGLAKLEDEAYSCMVQLMALGQGMTNASRNTAMQYGMTEAGVRSIYYRRRDR